MFGRHRKVNLLATAGVSASMKYGQHVFGVSPRRIEQQSRIIASVFAISGARHCVNTVLHIKMSRKSNPTIAPFVNQIALWCRIWSSSSVKEKKLIRAAWYKSLPQVLLGGIKWAKVAGPIAATQATLAELGWRPNSPDKWLNAAGDGLADINAKSDGGHLAILESVADAAGDRAWKNASKHFLGGGLELGKPNLKPAINSMRKFQKENRWQEARAAEKVITGGCWLHGRGDFARKCACGAAETAWHRYYGCARLEQSEIREIAGTKWLAKWIHDRPGRDFECLWARGILPGTVYYVDEEVADVNTVVSRSSPGYFDNASAKVFFSDGSGGSSDRNAHSPTVGTGACFIKPGRRKERRNDLNDPESNNDGDDNPLIAELGVWASAVPGRQTVPRAESWPVLDAINRVSDRSVVKFVVDAAYVANASHKDIFAKLTKGNNADIWWNIGEKSAERNIKVITGKVSSHMGVIGAANGRISIHDFICNDLADCLARVAADFALPPFIAQEHRSSMETAAFAISRRLAAIEKWHADVDDELMVAVPMLENLEPLVPAQSRTGFVEAIRAQGHNLVFRRRRVSCSRCRKQTTLNNYDRWISTECITAASSSAGVENAIVLLDAVGRKRTRNVVDDVSQPSVTLAKRRTMVRQLRVEAECEEIAREKIIKEAWERVPDYFKNFDLPTNTTVGAHLQWDINLSHSKFLK